MICYGCRQDKPIEAFSRQQKSGKARQGRQTHCKECLRVIYSADYNKHTPAERRAKKLRLLYKITLEDERSMRVAQDARCAICLKLVKLHVDHNHTTKEVRGLLCGNCNRGLGLFQDDITFLERSIEYLAHPPARKVLRKSDLPK